MDDGCGGYVAQVERQNRELRVAGANAQVAAKPLGQRGHGGLGGQVPLPVVRRAAHAVLRVERKVSRQVVHVKRVPGDKMTTVHNNSIR